MNINEEITAALKRQDKLSLEVLRGLKSAFANASLAMGNLNIELEETRKIEIIRKSVKQREDSIKMFRDGGRPELAEKEEKEKVILESFLPKGLSEEEINSLVETAIAETEAKTRKDMGRAMKRANEIAAGRVDGRVLSTLIGNKLNG